MLVATYIASVVKAGAKDKFPANQTKVPNAKRCSPEARLWYLIINASSLLALLILRLIL
jgi:hypothetical protein